MLKHNVWEQITSDLRNINFVLGWGVCVCSKPLVYKVQKDVV